MNVDRGEGIVATAMSEWPSSLEDVVLGTDDPGEIIRLVAEFCGRVLRVNLVRATFYKRGGGAVFGALLADGRQVVIKVHRKELIGAGLEGIRAVQGRLADQGLPGPKLLGSPRALGNGIAAAEELIDCEGSVNVHDESLRRVLVAGLRSFVEAA